MPRVRDQETGALRAFQCLGAIHDLDVQAHGLELLDDFRHDVARILLGRDQIDIAVLLDGRVLVAHRFRRGYAAGERRHHEQHSGQETDVM
jgi:hypothetical protein